jgi:hypothetical protein
MLWVRVKSVRSMFWDIPNSVSSGTTVQLMIKVRYFMLYNATAKKKKTSMAALQNVFDERFVTRLLWPPRSPDLYPCENHLSRTLIDATYNPQPFHQHSTAGVPPCVQKYFWRAPGLLRSWRSALEDCPVQYGTLNSEGCDWSLELRCFARMPLQISQNFSAGEDRVATGGRSYSPYGK